MCSVWGGFYPYPRASKPQKQALYDVIALRLRCNHHAFTAQSCCLYAVKAGLLCRNDPPPAPTRRGSGCLKANFSGHQATCRTMPKVCLQGIKAGQKRCQGTTNTIEKDVPAWLTDTYKNRQNRRIRTQGTTRLQITSGETRKV